MPKGIPELEFHYQTKKWNLHEERIDLAGGVYQKYMNKWGQSVLVQRQSRRSLMHLFGAVVWVCQVVRFHGDTFTVLSDIVEFTEPSHVVDFIYANLVGV